MTPESSLRSENSCRQPPGATNAASALMPDRRGRPGLPSQKAAETGLVPGAAVAETHAGVVFFLGLGDRAYKLKKPVDLGFWTAALERPVSLPLAAR